MKIVIFLLTLALVGLHIAYSQDKDEVVSSENIIEKLTVTKPLTRGIRIEPSNSKSSNNLSTNVNTINLRIEFQFGSSRLTEQAINQLNELGKAITSELLKNYTFEIGGHTDSVGNDEFNLQLSKQRAFATKNYLITKFKLNPNIILAHGFGEKFLLFKNDPQNKANRRVEIKAIKLNK